MADEFMALGPPALSSPNTVCEGGSTNVFFIVEPKAGRHQTYATPNPIALRTT
jgi:hypothetical protein